MKKRNMIFTAAAATAVLMSNPLVNKADAASIQPKANSKVIVESCQLNQDQINTILEKYKTSNSIDVNKVLAELQNTQQTAPKKPAAEPLKAPEPKKQAVEQKPAAEQKPASAPTPSKQTTPAPSANTSTETADSVSAYEKQVVELTNKERAKNGLSALQLDTELSKVARAKSQDMSSNNYFDHNSPTYGTPFDMMKKFGISYKAAGENIAKGQKTPEEVVQAWMNSEGHRANILSSKFTHIGVGYVENGNYWTQQFIGK
ncbi:CAP domain-containing protein [Niallia sp. 03133]|uniref:CAP domain-containing protein n=1 Tax=Niallia sp. 03133 TaxID=3458060 RepID=UPI0040450573